MLLANENKNLNSDKGSKNTALKAKRTLNRCYNHSKGKKQ